jgi:hypothetical protein
MLLQALVRSSFGSRADTLLVFGIAVLYILQLLVHQPELWPFAINGIAMVLLSGSKQLSPAQKRWGYVGLGGLILPALFFLWTTHAHAVLLQDVQDFFVRSFGSVGGEDGGDGEGSGGIADLINLIFNSARGIYIIFVVKAVWDGWQDFRQQEELSAYVRIMLGSLLGIFSIDLIGGLVIPAG